MPDTTTDRKACSFCGEIKTADNKVYNLDNAKLYVCSKCIKDTVRRQK